MNRDDIDPRLLDWFDSERAVQAPEGLLVDVLTRTSGTQPRASWRVAGSWLASADLLRLAARPPSGYALLALVLVATLVAGAVVVGASLLPRPSVRPYEGLFLPTGSMFQPRGGHTARLLPDGSVLVVGGQNDQGGSLLSAELYDPRAGTFSRLGRLHQSLGLQSATRLDDGRVLLIGALEVARDPELYEPAERAFRPTGPLSVPYRWGASATLLDDGRVLVVGGSDDDGVTLTTAELYDPAAGTFSLTGSMSEGRYRHAAVRLSDGRVLIVGGSGNGGHLTTAELYDPSSGEFLPTGPLPVPIAESPQAVLLGDGRVLIVGAEQASSSRVVPRRAAALYDPVDGTFEAIPATTSGIMRQTATLLADGRVLLAGGSGPFPDARASVGSRGDGAIQLLPSTSAADIFDPATDTFRPVASMGEARSGHSATLLTDGRVLLTGGESLSGLVSSAELFE